MGKLKIATLFSGVGTPENALKALGVEHETIFACEIDPYARKTYLANNSMPNTFYKDVRTLDANKYLNQIDGLVFGFPCQAFSLAGKQLGFEDTRGTFFFDAARVIKESKPKFFMAENVGGLISNDKPKTLKVTFNLFKNKSYYKWSLVQNQNYISIFDKKYIELNLHKIPGVIYNNVFYKNGFPSLYNKDFDGHKKGIGKTLHVIEKTMQEFDYKIYWQMLNTKDYQIPQNRDRIWIVGFKDNVDFEFAPKQELKLRLKDMLEDSVDSKYLLNQELVEKYLTTGTASNHKGSQAGKVVDESNDTFHTINAGTHGYSMGYVKLNQTHQLNIKGNDAIKRIYSEDGLFPALTTMGGGHREPKVAIANGLIEIDDEVRVKEAVKKGYTVAEEGDSINISVPSSKTRRGRVGKQVAQTLDTACNQVVFSQIKNYKNLKEKYSFLPETKYIFRKLTPRECFRLQGFDDTFIFSEKMSDTQLYKQAGNGMSRNILEMLFTQILIAYTKHIEGETK